jgi:glycosyltransferase involved in cell wall biosynthesis
LNRSVDGFPLTKEIRKSYRNWWLSAMSNGEVWPPSAFSKVEKFLEWMTTPVLGALHSPHSRAERSLWENSSYLQDLFPDIDATSSVSYREWLDRSTERKSLYSQVAEFNEFDSKQVNVEASGWNVLSGAAHEGDLADINQRCSLMIQACGLPVQQVKIRQSTSSKSYEFRPTASAFPVYEDLIAVNFNGEAGRLIDQAGFTRRPVRRRILLNMWDFNEVNPETDAMYRHFDEIWCPSEFVLQSVPKSCRTKVVPVNIPLEDSANFAGITKSTMGIPEDFIFLSIFDGGRFAGRDNPLAVVNAYLQSFQTTSGTRLVMRIVNGALSTRLISQMRYVARGRPDVTFVEGDSYQGEMIGLINAADCYVSMHRTTAFGTNMARAALAGKPLIATGYSGNLAFMGDLGLKVEYSLQRVHEDDSFAPEHAQWAKADIDDATNKMRVVANDYSRVSEAAREWSTQIREKYSIQNSVQSVRSSILGI